MTSNRFQTDQPTIRLIGRSAHRLRVAVALGCLAVLGITQTGCRSSGCSNCNLGSKLTNGVQALNARLFPNRGHGGGCGTCGTLGSVEEGVIVDSGVPIVTPGVIAIPPPGTIVPSPSIESVPRLEPIPSGPVGEANSSGPNRAQAGANRSAYEASANRSTALASKWGSDLTRAYHPSPSPTPVNFAPGETDVFDHLPPVELPSEVSRRTTADVDPMPPAATAPPIVVPQVEPTTKATSAEPDSAGGPLVLPLGPTATSARAAPGITRTASVAPLLAGGSLPTAEGLGWLKEKGYRTLVDLRPRTEVSLDFPDRVTDGGMLYVAIPFGIDPIDPTRLTRFNDLIGPNDQRPLYFCDTDGRRAGLIWYLRLRSQDHDDADTARSKAEEIGFLAGDQSRAEQFLKRNFVLNELAIDPIAINPPPQFDEPSPAVITRISLEPRMEPSIPADPYRPANPISLIGRNGSWKSVTAFVLSGLGVPLAYWSGSNLFQKRQPRRASLTVRQPGPRKSLPSSDV